MRTVKKASSLFLFVLAGWLASCNEPDITDPNTQLNKDIALIDQYLIDNEIEAIAHSSGVRYRFITEGTGTKPELYHYIRVKYKGMLMDEEATVFDQTKEDAKPPYATFFLNDPINPPIQGWRIGLPLLPEGSKAVLYIPSALAYGKAARSNIPANSNLMFEVELLDVIE